jgi:hypothetical protein
MANRIRRGVFHSVVGLGLLFATPLFTQSAAAQAPPPPPKVVDAAGRFVGWPRALGFSSTPRFPAELGFGVERLVNGIWLAIAADPGGFRDIGTFRGVPLIFTSPDCSGTTYLDASELPPTGWGVRLPSNPNLILLYPGTPVQLLTIGSFRFLTNGNVTTCSTAGGQVWVGPIQGFNLNSLGLVPPFTVK